MGETRTLRSWREILSSVCANPQSKQELAHAVGLISVRTIDRWISGQSNPQKNETIRKLCQVIGSEEMIEALEREFPDAFQLPKQPAVSVEYVNLPSEFYRRVAHAYSHVPPQSQRWTIFHLVSNQMLPHLDPERVGLVIIYIHCLAAAPHVVKFEEGAGNAFWMTRQINQSGSSTEPWLVQAVADCHPLFIQSCATSQVLPPPCLLRGDLIQSIGFFPLYRGGAASGGLLLCSTQEDFFTPLRQVLLEEYSCLFSLALRDRDFHPTVV